VKKKRFKIGDHVLYNGAMFCGNELLDVVKEVRIDSYLHSDGNKGWLVKAIDSEGNEQEIRECRLDKIGGKQ